MAGAPGYYGYFGHVADNESDSNHLAAVDELFDFPKEYDETLITDAFFDNVNGGNSNDDSSTVTAVDSCNSSLSGADHFLSGHFSGELCVPYDDLAELEWLSNFVEDSFSSDNNLHNSLQLIPAVQTATSSPQTPSTHPILPPFFPSSGKARSKRSRAAPNDWSSRLLPLSSPPSLSLPKPARQTRPDPDTPDPTRKCLHCGSDKTPQWRTGPMGPKTLCNACGVRHKSGRLVPEYRPAASPTFVSTKHSNSHRKVLELRRQKEMMQRQHEFVSQGSVFGGISDDYNLIHHRRNHSGPDNYRHMI